MKDADSLERFALIAGAIVQQFDAAPFSASAPNDADILQVSLLTPIEDEAPKRQASTMRGALFQLALAASDVAELIGTDGWTADALRARLQRIEGCLHSAINVFERECGLDRDVIGGAYYAPRSYVPEIWRDDARERA